MRLRGKRTLPSPLQGGNEAVLGSKRLGEPSRLTTVAEVRETKGLEDKRNLTISLDEDTAEEKTSEKDGHLSIVDAGEPKGGPITEPVTTRDSNKVDIAVESEGNENELGEILLLLEARKKARGFPRESKAPDYSEWQFVLEYCGEKGVMRSVQEWQSKWGSLLANHSKVKKYEAEKKPLELSYFDLPSNDRVLRLLPPDISRELYKKIEVIISENPVNKANLTYVKKEARGKIFKEEEQVVRKGRSNSVAHAQGTQMPDSVQNSVNAISPKRRRVAETITTASTEEATRSVLIGNTLMEENAIVANSDANSHGCREIQHGCNEGAVCSGQEEKEKGGISNGAIRLQEGEQIKTMTGALHYAEDMKDVRHRELLALERERLAAFRESCCAIVAALNGAVSAFSKVAEELLRHM